MKPSFKLLVGLVSAMSFIVGTGYSASAQSSSVDSMGNQTPGSSTPATERMGTTPGTTNDPSGSQPGSTGSDGGMAPATERMGTTPGTTNDPSGSQSPSSQQPLDSQFSSADSMSINEIVDASPSFELFNALLRVANLEDEGLVEMLDGDDSYVVYAPTDEAFAALPPDTIRTLVQPENRALLVDLLSYHIVPADAASTDSEAMGSMGSVGQTAPATGEVDSPSQLSDSTSSFNTTESSGYPMMRTDRASGSMMINEARVIGTNIEASNGTIYPIDRVILPSQVQSELGDLGLIPSTGTPNAISPNNSSPNSPGLNTPGQRPF